MSLEPLMACPPVRWLALGLTPQVQRLWWRVFFLLHCCQRFPSPVPQSSIVPVTASPGLPNPIMRFVAASTAKGEGTPMPPPPEKERLSKPPRQPPNKEPGIVLQHLECCCLPGSILKSSIGSTCIHIGKQHEAHRRYAISKTVTQPMSKSQ